MENGPTTLEDQEQTTDSTPTLSDHEIVKALHEQRERQPEGELPPVGESGERQPGEIYLTEDNREIKHRSYEDIDGDRVPIAEDLTNARPAFDGRISSIKPAQLHDNYHIGEGSSRGRISKRLDEDEAHMAADILKNQDQSSDSLNMLDKAVTRAKEIEDELSKLQEELDTLGHVSDEYKRDRSPEEMHKQELRDKIRDLKNEHRYLGRTVGVNGEYGKYHEQLDRAAYRVSDNYIDEVYKINPEYFKDMPTSKFVEIGKMLGQLQNKANSYYLENPTKPGTESHHLARVVIEKKQEKGETVSQQERDELRMDTTFVDFLKTRVDTGDNMTPEEIEKELGNSLNFDELDEDIFTAEDRAEFNSIKDGFYDRPPRETYQMYVDIAGKIGEAVEKQKNRNEQKYEEFVEDLKSRQA